MAIGFDAAGRSKEKAMLQAKALTAAAVLALAAAAPSQALDAARAPAVAVVVDPATHTAVIVPVNPNSDVPPEVTATLKALYATGKIQPGQVAEVVVRDGDRVTQVISNAPIPDSR
jgi:hypothetical protein